jgi:hypothetical protein
MVSHLDQAPDRAEDTRSKKPRVEGEKRGETTGYRGEGAVVVAVQSFGGVGAVIVAAQAFGDELRRHACTSRCRVFASRDAIPAASSRRVWCRGESRRQQLGEIPIRTS